MLGVHSKSASHLERPTKKNLRHTWSRAQGDTIFGLAIGSHGSAAHPEVNAVRTPCLSRMAKRGFDIIAAAVALVIFSPTFLLISIGIKLTSPGAILASEVLYGFENRHFSILKFRIMTKAANYKGILSRVLRITGTDRLPQLINVLRGEMSIVGPDPSTIVPAKDFEQQISSILQRVKPGMLGWARVNGNWGDGNPETMRRRLFLDQFYAERWSLLFDMKIIFMTMFFSRLAYPHTEKIQLEFKSSSD
jgi:lipopolysaccharide/colanic/teichoic acid biosynthesis glycosyltransferase